MGLDMYAYRKSNKAEAIEIATWRKHNMLHGWMEKLYKTKGGTGKFNCEAVNIEKNDLIRLKHDIDNFNFEKTEGFFFGSAYTEEQYEEYYKEEDLNFIISAHEALDNGEEVFYDSWW